MRYFVCNDERVIMEVFTPSGTDVKDPMFIITVNDEQVTALLEGAPPSSFRSIYDVKTYAVNRVNHDAGACRARYITVTPGQESTYQIKGQEADAANKVIADGGTPNPADYPMLTAEAQATGASFSDTLALVTQTAAAWRQLAVTVEAIRRGAIVQIENATTVAEVDAVRPQFP